MPFAAEKIFFNKVSDEQLEAAASGPIVTFTLSMVLFACQFCPSDRASRGSSKDRSR